MNSNCQDFLLGWTSCQAPRPDFSLLSDRFCCVPGSLLTFALSMLLVDFRLGSESNYCTTIAEWEKLRWGKKRTGCNCLCRKSKWLKSHKGAASRTVCVTLITWPGDSKAPIRHAGILCFTCSLTNSTNLMCGDIICAKTRSTLTFNECCGGRGSLWPPISQLSSQR